MSVELLTVLIFGSIVLSLALGLPLAFCLGGLAVLLTWLVWGPHAIISIYWFTIWEAADYTLLTIPLFVFMANMLVHAGIVDDLYEMMYRWIGGLGGGLAMGTVLISTIAAAMVGLSNAAVITSGVALLPAMLKRGYKKNIAMGSIAAGGSLGSLIPPSVILIVYCMLAETSIGRAWFGGFIPGLLLSFLFIAYIGVRCYFQPDLGPPLPAEEKASWKEKFISLRSTILPILVVFFVLGSVYMGIATVTESAAVGAAGAILCAAINRKLSWQTFKKACYSTLGLTCMVIWIVAMSVPIRVLFAYVRAPQYLESILMGLPFGRWGVLLIMQFIFPLIMLR